MMTAEADRQVVKLRIPEIPVVFQPLPEFGPVEIFRLVSKLAP